jgi:hypothetical protein
MSSRQTAEHFTWREVCEGWYLLNQPDRLTVLHGGWRQPLKWKGKKSW